MTDIIEELLTTLTDYIDEYGSYTFDIQEERQQLINAHTLIEEGKYDEGLEILNSIEEFQVYTAGPLDAMDFEDFRMTLTQ